MATGITRTAPRSNSVTRLPELMERLYRDSFVLPTFFDTVAGGASGASVPANLIETPEAYLMQVSLPGMVAENLDIQIVGREISIRGKVDLQLPENGSWLWQGIPGGEFYQTFTLPVEVNGESSEARYENGILALVLPKADHVRPRTIKVQTK